MIVYVHTVSPEPSLMGMESNDTFAIQPFASQPGLTNASSSFLSTTPPTNASLAGPSGVAQSISVAPTTSPQPQPLGGGANPYRMGTGMAARKPAYGTSGIASYTVGGGVGSLPTSQPTMAGPVFSPEMSSMLMQQPSLQPRPQVQWHSSLDIHYALFDSSWRNCFIAITLLHSKCILLNFLHTL